jgi:hypothetical protein
VPSVDIGGQQPFEEGSPMDCVDVQIQDRGGNWVTVSNVIFDLQRLGFELRAIALRYPDRRVRAVDKNGQLIDLL